MSRNKKVDQKDDQFKKIVLGIVVSIPLAFITFVVTVVLDWVFRSWGIK